MSTHHRKLPTFFIITLATMSGISVATAAIRDGQEPPKLLETVTVEGGSTSIPASEAELLRIADLFSTMKVKFSPAASLRFRVSSRDAQLTLSKDDLSTDVVLDNS